MPGPAVYVFVAIGTVATIYAFKEFIYDPHIHPKVLAWQETLAARRRARRAYVNVPHRSRSDSSSSSSDDDDDDVPLAHIRRQRSLDSASSSTPIELEDLVASEVDEWRSGVDLNRDQSGLRLRHNLPGSSQSPTVSSISSPSLMDEINESLISHPSLQPTPFGGRDVIFDSGSPASSAPPSGFPSTSFSLRDGAQTRREPHVDNSAQPWGNTVPETRVIGNGTASPSHRAPERPIIEVAAPSRADLTPSPGLPTPVSLLGALSPNRSVSGTSTPNSDLLTASVMTSLDAFYTPQTVSLSPSRLHSPSLSISSAPSSLSSRSITPEVPAAEPSRPWSPFSDVGYLSPRNMPVPMQTPQMRGTYASELPTSPFILGAADELLSPPSDIGDLASEDDDLFSLPSQTPSNADSDEDDFDNVSSQGSEASSWAGVDARGSPRM